MYINVDNKGGIKVVDDTINNKMKGTHMQEKIKITLSLDKQTLDLLDKYVSEHYLNSKSQAIRVLVNKNAKENEQSKS